MDSSRGISNNLFLGIHRQIKKNVPPHRFLSQLNENENSIPPLRELLITPQPMQETDRLKDKFDKLQSMQNKANPQLSEKLSNYTTLISQLKFDEELIQNDKSQFSTIKRKWSEFTYSKLSLFTLNEILNQVLDCLEKDTYVFFHKQKNYLLLDFIILIGSTNWSQKLIISHYPTFLNYYTLFVGILSKYMTYLKSDVELVTHFATQLQILSESSSQYAQIKTLTDLIQLSNKIYMEYYEQLKVVRKEFAKALEPQKELKMSLPILNIENFLQNNLIDEPETERKYNIARKILEEIYQTELSFQKKIAYVAEFDDFIEDQQDWKMLCETSLKILQMLKPQENLTLTIHKHFEVFTPKYMHEHFSTLKKIIKQFYATNNRLKNRSDKLKEFTEKYHADFLDILIMPMQRPPRYVLLLNELKKCFESKDTIKSIQERIDYVQKWAQSINLSMEEKGV